MDESTNSEKLTDQIVTAYLRARTAAEAISIGDVFQGAFGAAWFAGVFRFHGGPISTSCTHAGRKESPSIASAASWKARHGWHADGPRDRSRLE